MASSRHYELMRGQRTICFVDRDDKRENKFRERIETTPAYLCSQRVGDLKHRAGKFA
jgi:hypothetical protein